MSEKERSGEEAVMVVTMGNEKCSREVLAYLVGTAIGELV